MSVSSELPRYDNPTWHLPPVIRFGVRFAVLVWRWRGDHEGQRPLLGRLASHVALALTLVLFVVLGNMKLDSVASASQAAEALAVRPGGLGVRTLTTSFARPYYRGVAYARIARQAEAHTAIPDRPRLEIVTYTVQPGDTAEIIAEKFGLQPTTLMWSNPEMEKMPDLLRVGQILTILPIDGVYHTVAVSDTLESLAETYKVKVEDIINCPFNTIPENGQLTVGDKLIVPGGTKPYQAREVTTYQGPVTTEVTGSGLFYWPAAGVITQGYWYGHRAIDIGNSIGTAIIASDAGYVSFAGWTDIGYGYLVVLDHANGFQTYYAHLSQIYVVEGETVYAGAVIGAMGSTGNSTGPHLHYEIRYNGYPTNPLIYLP
ncbi:MAG TPA: peptidoglycan DD-metalloendopeptidase family protein [Anaerolineae bacterium]|nr:peptidoglycan DD-metalloendopeptidase family protein [Anaerolineae bacterium]HQK13521.1 peptidoglycan DD-metalloendopeptidase family protein [Anaerolineae bacterium]